MTTAAKAWALASATALGFMGLWNAAEACTTFSFKRDNKVFLGKSYDWDKEQGYVHVNKRNVSKTSLVVFPTDRPLRWTSKFGSVTFNQYGRELPNAGMNEAGLTVEVMVLGASAYPPSSGTSSINESQFVQYLLDTAGTASEAVARAKETRLSKILVPIHYLVCDSSSSCVTIEYINKELKITEATLIKALTNNTYESSVASLKQYVGFGGTKPIPRGRSSMDRFAIIADYIRPTTNLAEQSSFDFGFDGLEKVENIETKWQIVYNVDDRAIAFRSLSEPTIKNFKFSSFDFSCSKPVKVLNIRSKTGGAVDTLFTDYTSGGNEALVRESLGSSVPAPVVGLAIGLPATTKCEDKL